MLRAEKGYPIVGQDTDGTVTPQDLGMDWIVSKTKPDFLGKRSFARADTSRRRPQAARRPAAARPRTVLAEGAQLVADAGLRGDARPRHVELPQRRARPAVRAGARRAAAASGSARPSTRTAIAAEVVELGALRQGGRAPRWPSCVSSSSPPQVDRARRAAAGLPGRAEHDRRRRRRTCSGSARTSGSCSAAREADFPDAAAAVDVSANRVAFELAGDDAADVLAQGCALDLTRPPSRPAAARRRCSRARR